MKKAGHISILWCLVSCLIIADPAREEKIPDVNQILATSIEKLQKDWTYIANHYNHEELEITGHIKNGVLAEVENKRSLVGKRGTTFYKKLLSKNGAETTDSPFELIKDTAPANAKLLQRYVFELEKSETVNNVKCWVLFFKPRKGNLPEEEKRDRILNNLSGKMWVAQDTHMFIKMTARLIRDVDYYSPNFGFGLKVKHGEAVIETMAIEEHFALAKIQVEFKYSVRVLLWPINRHETITIYYQNYERRNQ